MAAVFRPPVRGSVDLTQTYEQAALLCQQQRFAEAERLCRNILAVAPNNFAALDLLCMLCRRSGRPTEAVAFGRKALNQRPRSVATMLRLGVALATAGRVNEARDRFKKALALEPTHVGALMEFGSFVLAEGDFDAAVACYEKALEFEPDNPDLHYNLGVARALEQRPAKAIECFWRAQSLAPDHANAHFNEGVARLVLGDFAGGWRNYEWRWAVAGSLTPRYSGPSPQWRGGPVVSGKTILLWAEQGAGDTIQFARYAPLVADCGARVILSVQDSLRAQMQTLDDRVEVIAVGQAPPAHEFHCPLMSLPLAFGTTLETIPKRVPYLSADPVKAASWQRRLEMLPGRRVGLVWFGHAQWGQSAINNPDRRRSMPLSTLAPLAKIGASFVSLQLGKPVHASAAPPDFVLHDWTGEIVDFSDTAALIAGLDLVISVDTSTAHLAGAMGKPVWLMNRFDTEWRWLMDRDDSPWYPTLRQFRQPKPGDWTSVIDAVRDELLDFVQRGSAS